MTHKETKSVDTDPANQHVDVDTKYEITLDESASLDACQMDAIKSHLEEVKNAETKSINTDPDRPQKSQVIHLRENTDDAEMPGDDTYQQTMYETSNQEEDVDKPYPEKTAALRNITIDSPLNSCVQRQTGFGDVAKKPVATNAASDKGEPNTQKTLCHNGMQDVQDAPDMQDVPTCRTASTCPMCLTCRTYPACRPALTCPT
jgi:hypothetical protein